MGTQLSKSRLKKLREKKVSYGTSRNSNSSNSSIDRISSDSSGSNRGNEDDIFLNRNGFTSIRKHLNSDINVSETYQLYIQHDLLREVWEGNFSSPIKKDLERGGIKVLNVGCGPGNWLCEMSSDYPKCFYMGVDNVELLPDNKPLNVMFIKHEFSQDLPFEDNTFDFVYMRLMIAEIAENRWEAVVKELVRVLKPGGWIELMEPNLDLKDLGPITKKINDIVTSKMKDLGMNLLICQRLEEYMRNTKSLVNINTSKKELFCGSSGGNLGEIAGTLIRNFYLKFMESSPDSIVNGILDENNDDKINNKNSSSIKNPASNYHNNNRSIGRIDNDSYGNSGRNRRGGRDGDVSELEKIMKNVAVELNIYKTYVENYRYIGRKIVPIFVPK